jgi:serine/threonine protein kinase
MSATCPQCGNPLPANTVRGLCPKCLALIALGGNPEETIKLSPTDIEPTLDPNLHYFGDYELLSEIARGGMGVVFKARQTSLKRVVAVKMILSGQLAGETEIKRFRLEAEAAAALQHPNIVAIHEVGQHKGRHYFSMDYVEGKNLSAVIGGQPMPAAEAAQLLKTVAEAVHFAHQRGTLHRDLKPQNILIDNAGQPRITDFGLAKQADSDLSLTQTGAIMGSPSYMAPEQASGRHDLVGPVTDVYALGAVLYEMITGQKVFSGETAAVVLSKVIKDDPTPPRKLNPSAPADLETICLKCLDKQTERRYPSARALAEDLDRFLRRESIQARPVPRWRKFTNNVRRRPWAVVGVATTLILGLLLVIDYLIEQNRLIVWQASHPGAALPRDPRWLVNFRAWPMLVAMYFGFYYEARRHGVGLRKFMSNSREYMYKLPTHAPSFRLALAAVIIGAAAIVSGLVECLMVIHLAVWRHQFDIIVFAGQVYAGCWFGGVLTWKGIRHIGTATGELVLAEENPKLTEAQLKEIATALEDGKMQSAIRLYRKATGVALQEAMGAVGEMAGKLYAEHPEQFLFDPRKPAPLDFPRGAAAAIVTVILLGLVFNAFNLHSWEPAVLELVAASSGFLLIWPGRWRSPKKARVTRIGALALFVLTMQLATLEPELNHQTVLNALFASYSIGLAVAAVLPKLATITRARG